jgi:hypothetical protein
MSSAFQINENEAGPVRVSMPDGKGGFTFETVAHMSEFYEAWYQEGLRVLREAFPPKQ